MDYFAQLDLLGDFLTNEQQKTPEKTPEIFTDDIKFVCKYCKAENKLIYEKKFVLDVVLLPQILQIQIQKQYSMELLIISQ